jgi:hypothetical protein
MARHTFNFDGGEYLTTMGAAWFVSYSFYNLQDQTHLNWERVSTCPSRISTFNRTNQYHKFWLQQVLNMKDDNLNKNTIGLNATQIKQMARLLLP